MKSAHAGKRHAGALVTFARRDSSVNQGEFHVGKRVGARNQIEGLKNKTDFRVARIRTLAAASTLYASRTLELRAGLFAQHDQQHARGFGRVNGMRHVRGHQHQGLGCRNHAATADDQRERSRQGEHERIKRCRVL